MLEFPGRIFPIDWKKDGGLGARIVYDEGDVGGIGVASVGKETGIHALSVDPVPGDSVVASGGNDFHLSNVRTRQSIVPNLTEESKVRPIDNPPHPVYADPGTWQSLQDLSVVIVGCVHDHFSLLISLSHLPKLITKQNLLGIARPGDVTASSADTAPSGLTAC